MRYFVGTTIHLLHKPHLRTPFYTQARCMSTSFVQPPRYELDAKAYREKLAINCHDTNSLYGLAVCISLGASIHASDLITTQRMAIWVNKNTTTLDIQASLYRQILRVHSKHTCALWGLAQCLRKGAAPQPEDLRDTWLQDGSFFTENGPGLTKPVILLLAQALEEKSKQIETSSKNTKKNKKSI